VDRRSSPDLRFSDGRARNWRSGCARRNTILAGLTLVGVTFACRKETPAVPSSAENPKPDTPAYLEVLNEPAVVERARRRAIEGRPAPLSPESLQDVWHITKDVIPAEMSDADVRRTLRSIASAPTNEPWIRAKAICLLILVDVDEGRATMIEGLQSADGKSLADLMSGLCVFIPRDHQVANAELVDWVAGRLLDPDVGAEAARLCARLQPPDVESRLWGAYPDATEEAKTAMLLELCRFSSKERVYQESEKLLADASPRNSNRLLDVFECLLAADDASIRQRAADLLARRATMGLQSHPADVFTVSQSACVNLLCDFNGPAIDALAAQIQANSRDAYLKMCVYLRERRVEGDKALPRILADLRIPELRQMALFAIEKLYGNTRDESVVAGLADAIRTESDDGVAAKYAMTLLDIGGERAESELRAACPRLPLGTREEILARLDEPPDRQIVEWLNSEGVIDAPDAEAFLSSARRMPTEFPNEDEPSDAPMGLTSILHAAGVFIVFDAETGVIPVRHDQLIEQFGAASGGAFRPTACYEEMVQDHPDDWKAPYRVEFVAGDRLYRFGARNFGDWYDVERIVDVCNRALKDAGSSRRFFSVAWPGQIACFVCVTPKQAKALSDKFHLVWSDDLDAAMREGKAYEEQVIRQMESGS